MAARWFSRLKYGAAGIAAVVAMGLSPSPQVWGPDVVWTPSAKSEAKMRECVVYECFVFLMQDDETAKRDFVRAAQFSRAVRVALGADVYAMRFRELGQVDVVEAAIPQQMNEGITDYIVNGYPEIVPVDDWKQLQQLDLSKDPNFWRIRMKHPKAQIWFPASFDHMERDGTDYVLVFNATIRDGGRAGAIVGVAQLSHVFSRIGGYQGLWLKSTRPVG